MATHPLFNTLKELKGNARSCVYTEPLWGIPFNLFVPYISVYMFSLGVKDSQIGLITSISFACQVVFALLGGVITDKFGRKLTTLLWDLVAWSIPCLIWAFAQNFTYFLIAAILNSTWRITSNSWVCLLVEDTDSKQIVPIYSWIYIAGLLAAFFAPIAGLLIRNYQLVATMRGLYLFAFVLMTIKFFLLNGIVSETSHGKTRQQETRNQSIFTALGEYHGVFQQILKSPATLSMLGIMVIVSICLMVNGTFWALLVTEKLHIPTQNIALFPVARSLLMLVFFFVVLPRINPLHFQRPILIGFATFVVSQLLLISMPGQSYILLLLSVLLEGCALALINPLLDALVSLTVDPLERARILSILYVIVILITSPFGWIAGKLSEMNRILPFVLNIALFSIGGVLVFLYTRYHERKGQADAIMEEAKLAAMD